ncbi:hypothetical protein IMZ68_05715 [Candidatus Bathyarchaeota archaeon]|nr:hypothetical protein [Candidatus Bathyarchaeota archaeon]
MKKLILSIVLIAGIASAQTYSTFEQVYRNDGSGAVGTDWRRSATHYTNLQDMSRVDSAWLIVNFPDSVDCAIKVDNYTASDGVVSTSALINTDSTIYATDNTGISAVYTLKTFYQEGYPLIRFRTLFSAIKNHTDAVSEKYKYYIMKFYHK